MGNQLSERLESHPELKKHVEAMLDIAEDVAGTLKQADFVLPTMYEPGSP